MPDPIWHAQVMVPRLGYLPTIAAQVQQYFQVNHSNEHAWQIEQLRCLFCRS